MTVKKAKKQNATNIEIAFRQAIDERDDRNLVLSKKVRELEALLKQKDDDYWKDSGHGELRQLYGLEKKLHAEAKDRCLELEIALYNLRPKTWRQRLARVLARVFQ